jgi:hypothetical protein
MGTVTRIFRRKTTEQLFILGQDLQKILTPWSERNGYKISVSIDSRSDEPALKITITNSEELIRLMQQYEHIKDN